MIAQLTGTVLSASATQCVIDVGGVGYLIHVTASAAASLRPGEMITLHTSLVVREDAMTLYGFHDAQEREAFIVAQSASGVGPKLALAIVSVLTPADFRRAIQTEDLRRLTSVPGIGNKGAQKLVIELRDKVMALGIDGGSGEEPAVQDAASAEQWRVQVADGLQSLGWSARDAETACDNVAHLVEEDQSISMGKLLRAALNSLARR